MEGFRPQSSAGLRELLTRLTHTNPVRRKRPIMSLLLGYSLGLSWSSSMEGFAMLSRAETSFSNSKLEDSKIESWSFGQLLENPCLPWMWILVPSCFFCFQVNNTNDDLSIEVCQVQLASTNRTTSTLAIGIKIHRFINSWCSHSNFYHPKW